MKVNRVYRRCHVTSKGELISGLNNYSFTLQDVSASGASIELKTELDASQVYDTKITLIGDLIDITLHPKAKITRSSKANDLFIYGLTFIGLTEHEKVQIDEIVNHQCMVDDHSLGENCEEGSCLFKRRKHH